MMAKRSFATFRTQKHCVFQPLTTSAQHSLQDRSATLESKKDSDDLPNAFTGRTSAEL